jgi:predicted heme/steroid binding protein
MRQFTREDLANCHGRDGAPACIAFEGKVYDVSRSFQWQRGRHQVRHPAGVDYTGGLDDAPTGRTCSSGCRSSASWSTQTEA